MYIAKKLRKENITAYIIYMFQVEDMLRACHLDMEQVERSYLARFGYEEAQKQEAYEWYAALIRMMKEEGCQEKGHVQVVKATLALLYDRHCELMQDTKQATYHACYYKALPNIVALRAHGGDKARNEVENCLEAIYGFTLLKMKGQSPSQQTCEAITPITRWMEMLSQLYERAE